MQNIKVAISQDFMMAFANIPRSKQKKVMEFVTKFRRDPQSPGINYEKINDARVASFRSVRIDQNYRGIVMKPDDGNAYILLWVDKHDAAYTWAARHTCQVHPETGTLQIYETETVARPLQPDALNSPIDDGAGLQPVSRAEPARLLSCSREQLLKIGVPDELTDQVLALRSPLELEALEKRLPVESFEALYFLSEGMPWDEVYAEYSQAGKEPIDTADIASALERPSSQRNFHVVEDELELIEMLEAPLERWRVFLHPSQRKLVDRHWNGPVRVLGGAGTGKTVVAMHRAKWLARHVAKNPGERILFTTFTANLATDIRDNLRKICKPEELARIEVVHIDKWVSEFLRRHKYPHRIVYQSYDNEYRSMWRQALSLAPAEPDLHENFYQEEWQRVILPNRVHSRSEYFRANRIGRGIALTRKQRAAIWPVFEELRNMLHQKGMRTFEDATLDACDLLEMEDIHLPYRSVIVDETQDMGPEALTLIRQLTPEQADDLFLVGDGHQRIYRRKTTMSHCGIKIVGRSRKLRINYRTTEETRRFATAILEDQPVDDLDGGIDDQSAYRSLVHGDKPVVQGYDDLESEIQGIAGFIRSLGENGVDSRDVCLVARTKALRDEYARGLETSGFQTYTLEQQRDDRKTEGVRIATMHRVKGLEFQAMIIAGVSDRQLPPAFVASTQDPVEARQQELNERALLHVAATRSIKWLFVTWSGQPSKFLANRQ